MGVVSLLPAATERVCALGAGRELVGTFRGCDYPPGLASRVPVPTRSRLDPEASSLEIDRAVRVAAVDVEAHRDAVQRP